MYTYDTELGWGDLLVGYDGNTITRDGIGNPLSDGTWTYTWKHGRQLESMSDSDVTWTYQYNADGLRTYRYSDDASYYYSYIGDKLWHYIKDYTSFTITYDAMGMPYSLSRNNDTYYYILNVQGDIVAINDDEGNTVVYYVYDAWGNLISMTDTSGCGLGTGNVLRYRGYVYDTELGLYYLQSRYYNPEWGRFLDMDNVELNIDTAFKKSKPNVLSSSGIDISHQPTPISMPASPNMPLEILHSNNSLDGFSYPIRDVTAEVNSALYSAATLARQWRKFVDAMPFVEKIGGELGIYSTFYAMVNHNAVWDIKRPMPWVITIGTDYPGFGVPVMYCGRVVTVEDLGNFTYGYLGAAYGLSYEVLITGSYVAAGLPGSGAAIHNEIADWEYISLGYFYGLLGY